MYGSHFLRFWSKTQATIALSSGESETLAAIRAGTEALGMMALLSDLGIHTTSTLRLDASAALGILQRKGVGKIRHLDVGCLWLQEKEAREQLRLAKEPGESNPADLGTKHLSEEVMVRHLTRMSCEFRDGRPVSSSKVIASAVSRRAPVAPESKVTSPDRSAAKKSAVPRDEVWTQGERGPSHGPVTSPLAIGHNYL